jgi:hypothetical protein
MSVTGNVCDPAWGESGRDLGVPCTLGELLEELRNQGMGAQLRAFLDPPTQEDSGEVNSWTRDGP